MQTVPSWYCHFVTNLIILRTGIPPARSSVLLQSTSMLGWSILASCVTVYPPSSCSRWRGLDTTRLEGEARFHPAQHTGGRGHRAGPDVRHSRLERRRVAPPAILLDEALEKLGMPGRVGTSRVVVTLMGTRPRCPGELFALRQARRRGADPRQGQRQLSRRRNRQGVHRGYLGSAALPVLRQPPQEAPLYFGKFWPKMLCQTKKWRIQLASTTGFGDYRRVAPPGATTTKMARQATWSCSVSRQWPTCQNGVRKLAHHDH